jgi:hypothetical protein
VIVNMNTTLATHIAPPILEREFFPHLSTVMLAWEPPDHLTLNLRGGQAHRFKTIYRPDSSERSLRSALNEARHNNPSEMQTLVVLPYLSPTMLHTLEQEHENGLDLCGNALVRTPELLLSVTGQPNYFQAVQPKTNPYQGKAALVTRAVLKTPLFHRLDDLQRQIQSLGGVISQPMVSRTLAALEEDYIVAPKSPFRVSLLQPDTALERLVAGWARVPSRVLWRGRVRLPLEEFLPQIFKQAKQKVRVTGVGSVAHHTSFSLENMAYVYAESVSDVLGNLPAERTERFPNLEIRYCKDPGAFFDPQPDPHGIIWASQLQTVLEGLNGDARLQDAVTPLKNRLIAESRAKMLEGT